MASSVVANSGEPYVSVRFLNRHQRNSNVSSGNLSGKSELNRKNTFPDLPSITERNGFWGVRHRAQVAYDGGDEDPHSHRMMADSVYWIEISAQNKT
jgi:hypothetical protein